MVADARELEMFTVCTPGCEARLDAELRGMGALRPGVVRGGVAFGGGAELLARCNLWLRTATRVLVRAASFPVFHLAQLDKRARRVDWDRWIVSEQAVRVRASCHRSRIYHSGAAAQRVARAIAEATGARVVQDARGPAQDVLVRIERDRCTISLDGSGEPLYRRGHKPESGGAPLRETLAAAILGMCGYTGDEPLLDPMCGSGTLAMEAALIALDRAPGLGRDFACAAWPWLAPGLVDRVRDEAAGAARDQPRAPLFAADHKAGEVAKTGRNLARAGLDHVVEVRRFSLEDLEAPAESGLVICNPPYGRRLGDRSGLDDLYAALGDAMRTRLAGWRLGMITSHRRLARATGLDFSRVSDPLAHGGLKVRLYQARPARG